MTTVNEISGIITSPFYPRRGYLDKKSCSWEIRAKKKENELYLLLKTWIFIGGAVEDGIACVIIWKFKVDPFQATMVPNGVYVPLL